MKVYVVTAGCYSDYHIEAVFTDKKKARAFANINTDMQIEDYDADSVEMAEAGIKARIQYDPKTNEITEIDTSDYVQRRLGSGEDYCMYGKLNVYRKLSARTLVDIQKHGRKSTLLLKHMQDAWAFYKAMHEPEEDDGEDEEVYIRLTPEEAANAFKCHAEMYNAMFTSTSGEM